MKYPLTRACGHEEVQELFGPGSERKEKIAWLESSVCLKCHKEEQEEARKRNNAIAGAKNTERKAVQLVGSAGPPLLLDYEAEPHDNFTKAAFRFWSPPYTQPIRGVVVIVPGFEEDGRGQANDSAWQDFARKHHLALMACFLISLFGVIILSCYFRVFVPARPDKPLPGLFGDLGGLIANP